jgi:hypothetical protein
MSEFTENPLPPCSRHLVKGALQLANKSIGLTPCNRGG